jgi:hypothetical protein
MYFSVLFGQEGTEPQPGCKNEAGLGDLLTPLVNYK